MDYAIFSLHSHLSKAFIIYLYLNILIYLLSTIKTRLQKSYNTNLYHLVKDTLVNEGIYGFYKGMGFPVFCIPLINSLTFGTNEIFKKLCHVKENEELSHTQNLICGCFAGLVSCIVVTPSELVKCKLQIQFEDKRKSYYTGVFDCILKEYKSYGIRGLYKGNLITIIRDVPGVGAQFIAFEYMKDYFRRKYPDQEKSQINEMIELLIAGGLGGVSCWIVSYPQDTIKTYIQTNSIEKQKFKSKYYDGGIINCCEFIYKSHGYYGFCRGFLVTIIRAFYANAYMFCAFEKVKLYLERRYLK